MFDIRKGMPLLVLDQVTYADDRIIEYVNVISRADRYKYVTNLSSYPT
jgi:DNA-binding GntR family transcriptional regulator